jgi:excisionase family DNA binding protein
MTSQLPNLSIKEFATKLEVSVTTAWRMVKNGRIKAIKQGGQYFILEEEYERYLNPFNFPPFDIENWITQDRNAQLFSKWVNPNSNILWHKMKITDFYAYYRLVIYPKYKKYLLKKKHLRKTPTIKWLVKHKFQGFVQAINEGYLWNVGIKTITQFFRAFSELM